MYSPYNIMNIISNDINNTYINAHVEYTRSLITLRTKNLDLTGRSFSTFPASKSFPYEKNIQL